ncbi:hypothetical protein QUF75_16050, partial [Desulfococcaceae bacterium HSG7]|nr:hypothetical protein [Desulfococcaceae bacterium HSG7]
HLFVEQLCQYLMADSLNRPTQDGPARAAVIKCRDVAVKTVLLMFRVRNVIEEKRVRNQFVAEEMLLWGYAGSPQDNNFLDQDQVKLLMSHVAPSANLTDPAKAAFLENELENIAELRQEFDKIALQRAEILIQAHERFRKVMGGKRYKAVEPVLPMDLMGVYILLPDRTSSIKKSGFLKKPDF